MKIIYIVFLNFIFLLNAQTSKEVSKQLKSAGLTKNQAKQMAKDRGLSDKQIELEIQSKDNKASKEVVNDETSVQSEMVSPLIDIDENTVIDPNIPEAIENNELDLVEEELSLETVVDSTIEEVTYYGYQIFQGDPEAFQTSTFGAVDPNYNIGPGDQIIVMLWGESQFRQEFNVDRGGYIFVPEVGQIFVNGLNLEDLEKKLFQTLSKVYSTLNPDIGKPTTFMDISLGNLRPLRIIVLGEVSQPGAYSVSPSTSLSSSLYYFRGPTTLGSLRDIRLLRNNKLIGSIDFYDYLLLGKAPNDLRLQLDDIVFIPPRGKTVTIYGEINRPAIYELADNEGFKELINIAGGLPVTTYMERGQIDRIISPEDRKELGMDRILIDFNLSKILNSKENYPLQDGDRVNLFSILDLRENIVSISGAVVRPGTYEFGLGLTIRDLILRADSLVGDSYLDRAEIIRVNSDLTERLLKINLKKVMSNEKDHNLMLKPMDRVRIYSSSEMISPHFVSITGYVQRPGRYNLRDNMNLYDLIFMGGGMADEEWLDQAYMERADLIRLDSDNITSRVIPFNLENIINGSNIIDEKWKLEDGDIIRIYSKTMFNVAKKISIDGSVNNPGEYTLKSNMTIKDLILEAGGISENVYSYKIEISRIDPKNKNKNHYSKIINLKMSDDFAISYINNQSIIDPKENNLKRKGFKLEPYDRISIRPDPNFSMQKVVEIVGEVNYPGKYSITNPDEKVSDIIKRSGGLRDEAYPMASVLIRNQDTIRVSFSKIVNNNRSKDNFNVLDGDKIVINSRTNIVYMIGELHTPGNYKFYPGKSLRSYISLAGGLTVDAEKKGIWITYPDGTSRQMKKYLPSPKVYDGSVINVTKKADTEPLDKTEFAKEIASIIADFLQVYISLMLLWQTASSV